MGQHSRQAMGLALACAALVLCVGAGAQPLRLHPLGPVAHVGPMEARFRTSAGGKWTNLANPFPGPTGPDTALLMTDGTVLMHSWCSRKWYRLTPDQKGSYVNGTWSQAASLPSGYLPFYFASKVLADGRLIVNGGEYNAAREGRCSSGSFETSKGALYDNVSDSWTPVSPPAGWGIIGDAQSVMLPGRQYMLASCCSMDQALATISGSDVEWTATGGGKADVNAEEGWTLLPNGKVLTVDANNGGGGGFSLTELYDPATGTWSRGPHTTANLVDLDSHEIGPGVLRPDGTVIWFGGVPHNSLYDSNANTWNTAPDFPLAHYDVADGPAALLPNGNVLVEASPGVFRSPAHFFEFDGMAFTQVSDPDDAPNDSSFQGRFLVLPTGQVLYSNDGQQPTAPVVAVYTPRGKPHREWRPRISSVSTNLSRGSANNPVSGKKFNGFSEGAYYGDDAQESTNYPIVMIANNATGDICFARSHDFSHMGVASPKKVTAQFDVPSSCETGASTLRVSVNGIASKPVAVILN